MVLANVAAAQALEQRHAPCLYRVHDQPDAAKLEALREFLGTLGIAVPIGQRLRPADLNRVLHAGRRQAGGAAGQPDRAAQPEPGGLQPRQSRPFRPGAGALRPLHLADPPLSRPDRPSRADRGLRAGRRRPGRSRQGPLRASSASTFRCASAAPSRPSAAPWIAMSRPTWRPMSAPPSPAGSPASRASACSSPSTAPAPTG